MSNRLNTNKKCANSFEFEGAKSKVRRGRNLAERSYSFLKMLPSFITKDTLRTAWMSSSGFKGVAMMSAA